MQVLLALFCVKYYHLTKSKIYVILSAHCVLKGGVTVELIYDEMSDRIIDATESIAINEGTAEINVRRILHTLNVSNRVFYNRFHNVEEVLDAIYERTVMKMRESLKKAFEGDKDFYIAVSDVAAETLVMSYENKMNFNAYAFYEDSRSQKNYEWWKSEIEKIIRYGKENGYLNRELDTDTVSYSVWCFIRGYNTDAVMRGIPKDEAVKKFRYSFEILLKGMK